MAEAALGAFRRYGRGGPEGAAQHHRLCGLRARQDARSSPSIQGQRLRGHGCATGASFAAIDRLASSAPRTRRAGGRARRHILTWRAAATAATRRLCRSDGPCGKTHQRQSPRDRSGAAAAPLGRWSWRDPCIVTALEGGAEYREVLAEMAVSLRAPRTTSRALFDHALRPDTIFGKSVSASMRKSAPGPSFSARPRRSL